MLHDDRLVSGYRLGEGEPGVSKGGQSYEATLSLLPAPRSQVRPGSVLVYQDRIYRVPCLGERGH